MVKRTLRTNFRIGSEQILYSIFKGFEQRRGKLGAFVIFLLHRPEIDGDLSR